MPLPPYAKLESTSASASETPTPARKGKKRVGWHQTSGSGGSASGGLDVNVEDLGDPTHSPMEQPPTSSPIPPGAPDPHELSSALSKIMTSDEWQRRETGESSTIPEIREPSSRSPVRPRPVLRRDTSYDAHQERETADEAEMRASERQQQSINDARHRAARLANSLGSYSAPVSRRHSQESLPAFHLHIGDSNAYDAENDEQTTRPSQPDTSGESAADGYFLRHRSRHGAATQGSPDQDSDWQSDDQDMAERLVRSYTRGRRDLSHHHGAHRGGASTPGTATPIPFPDDSEYVPRPSWYRGGVLASLLKLQRDERGSGGSGYTTPSAQSSPVSTPGASPPTSRSPSIAGSIRSRPPRDSFFGLHRLSHSASSVTLTELMKSTSMLAAPASGEISDKVAEKIKKSRTPRSRKDKIKITVHIAGIISRHRYLLKLCRALMMYGAPTHRLEEYMAMSSRVLEIEGQFLYIPSCMIISFDDSTTHTTEVKVVRVPQGVDLGRLRDVHIIYKEVVHDKLGVEEATRRLDEVMKRRPKFSKLFRVLVYGIASACVAPFAFEGRFIDLPIAFLLGCLVGLLQLVFAPSNELYAHVFEVTASVITSFIARGFGSINNGELFCFSALAQSSIALILPGYMVLCSSLELQSHNIVAGSVRMVYAMIYTLFLGYGITIGASLYGMLDSNAASQTTCSNPLRREWYFLFVSGFTLCLCVINQAQWKQTPVMLVMALAGFCVNSYCSQYFESNSQISNMLGALAVGILANLYSRVGRHFWNGWLDLVDWWNLKVVPRLSKRKKTKDGWPLPSISDPESRPSSPDAGAPRRHPRQIGYSLAAAAMLPAIFVQVPSGLAAGGSLLAGITSANEITGGSNSTKVHTSANTIGNLDGTAFNVLFSVIQVAIGISVGLFMSALIVYPLGKRRSGLFSF